MSKVERVNLDNNINEAELEAQFETLFCLARQNGQLGYKTARDITQVSISKPSLFYKQKVDTTKFNKYAKNENEHLLRTNETLPNDKHANYYKYTDEGVKVFFPFRPKGRGNKPIQWIHDFKKASNTFIKRFVTKHIQLYKNEIQSNWDFDDNEGNVLIHVASSALAGYFIALAMNKIYPNVKVIMTPRKPETLKEKQTMYSSFRTSIVTVVRLISILKVLAQVFDHNGQAKSSGKNGTRSINRGDSIIPDMFIWTPEQEKVIQNARKIGIVDDSMSVPMRSMRSIIKNLYRLGVKNNQMSAFVLFLEG